MVPGGERDAEHSCARVGQGTLLLRTARRQLAIGERTLLMGILNRTPDSFSDGGRFWDLTAAVDEGRRMVDAGADILDIGGESSRPGALPISLQEESDRVLPLVEALAGSVDVPLSVDTTKAELARLAVACGAEIINDISALRGDSAMTEVVSKTGAAVVLMHMRGTPQTMQTGDLHYADLCGDILGFLEERIRAAAQGGIAAEQILIDPGVGFGKTVANNFTLMRHLFFFHRLQRPIVLGPSRKSFLGVATGDPPSRRLEGTAAAVAAAIFEGCHILRVHDVAFMKKVAQVADRIARA